MLPGFLRRDPESPSLARWQAVLLFVLLAAFFIGVPIHRFDTEALKQSMSVPGEPEVAAVNHPYSGKVFYYWWRLVSELGVGEPGFDRRMVWIGALNGLLGAGGIVLLVDLVRRQGANFVVSVAAGVTVSGAVEPTSCREQVLVVALQRPVFFRVAAWRKRPFCCWKTLA